MKKSMKKKSMLVRFVAGQARPATTNTQSFSVRVLPDGSIVSEREYQELRKQLLGGR